MKPIKNIVARLESPRQFAFIEDTINEVDRNSVITKVISSGICSSEIPFFTGVAKADPKIFIKYAQYPLNLGHELSGRVVRTGANVTKFQEGDLVTCMSIYGSGFAKYFIEKEESLIKIPANIDPAFALGEPIMCTMNILRSFEPEIGDNVVIIGDGFMGLLLTQLLSQYPLKSLSVIGLTDTKLNLAKDFGARYVFSYKDQEGLKYLYEEILEDKGADAVIELAGNQKALETAAWLVKSNRGKLVMPAFYGAPEPFTIGGYLMRKGPQLIPAHPAYSKNLTDDLQRGVWAVADGMLSLEKLITHTFKFDQLNEAFEFASKKKPEYIKGIINIS